MERTGRGMTKVARRNSESEEPVCVLEQRQKVRR